jgi:signal transduction histidine kinase
MRLDRVAGGKGWLALAIGLTLGPGLALGYFALRAVEDREEAIRASYATTSALIRDRLLAELATIELDLGRDAPPPPPAPELPAFQSWLRDASARHAGEAEPFLLHAGSGVATTSLSYGWPASLKVSDSVPSALTAALREAETIEFVRGDLDLALRRYRQTLSLAGSPPSRAMVLSRIGRTLFKLRYFEEGVTAYREILALPPDVIDSHGIPYAVTAHAQVVDGLDALGWPKGRDRAGLDFLRWSLDHPWDGQNGYGYYLSRARKAAASASADLEDRAGRVMADLSTLAWLHREVQPRIAAEITRPGRTARPERTVADHDGTPVLISAQSVPLESSGSGLVIGLAVRPDHISGSLLTRALSGVELGGDVNVALIDRSGRNPARSTEAVSPLGSADLSAVFPGWRVGVFDARGRTLDELGARERWLYRALVAGMMGVLLVGVLFAARAWVREAELSKLRTDFVSSVSHELKTPLALIRMFGETLESGLVPDEGRQREFHGIIRRESERLTHLINNVLDTAKIDAGTKRFALQPDDLVAVVGETLDAYGPFFRRLGFTVTADLPATPVAVEMDRDAIAQVLVNLFQNAIKYSADVRSVAVSLTTGEDCVRLAVGDRGIGIPAAEIPRIFEKYYRIERADAEGAPGSGLGLAIIKHAMAAHGGRVDVASTPGQGSTFTLVFRPCGDFGTGAVARGNADRVPDPAVG